MDALPVLETRLKHDFPHALTPWCWFHWLGNALAKTLARLRDVFKIYALKVMCAPDKYHPRLNNQELKDIVNEI